MSVLVGNWAVGIPDSVKEASGCYPVIGFWSGTVPVHRLVLHGNDFDYVSVLLIFSLEVPLLAVDHLILYLNLFRDVSRGQVYALTVTRGQVSGYGCQDSVLGLYYAWF